MITFCITIWGVGEFIVGHEFIKSIKGTQETCKCYWTLANDVTVEKLLRVVLL